MVFVLNRLRLALLFSHKSKKHIEKKGQVYQKIEGEVNNNEFLNNAKYKYEGCSVVHVYQNNCFFGGKQKERGNA